MFFKKYNRKSANQNRPVFNVEDILSPEVSWSTIKNFKLANIPIVFRGLDFQRKINTAHVYKLVESIINNQFYDNIIRVIKIKDQNYQVIDGQHRLHALWILHTQYGVQTYDLVLQEFLSDEARTVFQKINAGKKLTLEDYLKSLDDKNIKFFNELRDVTTHYVSTGKPTYLKLLNSIKYSRDSSPRPLTYSDFKIILATVTDDEISHCHRMTTGLITNFERMKNNRIFNANIMRPLLWYGIKHNFLTKDYEHSCKKLLEAETSDSRLHSYFTHHADEIKKRVVEVLDSKTGQLT